MYDAAVMPPVDTFRHLRGFFATARRVLPAWMGRGSGHVAARALLASGRRSRGHSRGRIWSAPADQWARGDGERRRRAVGPRHPAEPGLRDCILTRAA